MGCVIVTGAGSGIGAASCRRLAAAGIELVIHTGQRREAAEALAAECAPVRSRVVVGDLTHADTVPRLLDAAAALGRLQGVVANAGFSDRTPLLILDDAALEHSLQAMVVALARLLRASLPVLAGHPGDGAGGRFVAVSSFVAQFPNLSSSTFPATAAAKAGVEALVRAAAIEAAADGTTVNAVAPGYVRKDRPGTSALDPQQLRQATARIPLGRLCTPDDIAAAICFLLGEDAAMITGQVLRVDGGLTL